MNDKHYFDGNKWIHIWHQSDLKKFEMCPEQARLLWSGVVKDLQGDGAALGTACHYAIEKTLEVGTTYKDDPDFVHSVLMEAFDQGLTDVVPTIDTWHSYGSVEKMVTVGMKKLDSWWEEVCPQLQAEQMEVSFEKLLWEDNERKVIMRGQVDLIDSGFGLVDWKFPKRDYTKDKWQYERWDIQATTYCWAMGYPSMTYFVMHGNTGGVSSMTIERDANDFLFLRRKVEAACRLVEATNLESWSLNDAGWWCSEKWAPCWHICKGKHQQASEDANG